MSPALSLAPVWSQFGDTHTHMWDELFHLSLGTHTHTYGMSCLTRLSPVRALPDVLQQLGVPLLFALQARQLLQEMDPQLLGELHLREGPAQPRFCAAGMRCPPARVPPLLSATRASPAP